MDTYHRGPAQTANAWSELHKICVTGKKEQSSEWATIYKTGNFPASCTILVKDHS